MESSLPNGFMRALSVAIARNLNGFSSEAIRAELEVVRVRSSTFSGTPIYRTQFSDYSFALRAWPMTDESVSKINCWLEASNLLLREMPCHSTIAGSQEPRISLPISIPLQWHWARSPEQSPLYYSPDTDFFWTLSTWVPGAPLQQSEFDAEFRCKLLSFLASFHRSTSEVGAVNGKSKGFQDRLAVCLDLDRGEHRTLNGPALNRLTLSSELLAHTRGILNWGHVNSQRLRQVISGHCSKDWTQHWILRDFWRENVLYDSSTSRFYLVDFGASRCDSPVFDLIRLLGTLRSTLADWEQGWADYQTYRGRSLELSWQEGVEVHRVSTLGGILFWLKRLDSLVGTSDITLRKEVLDQAGGRLQDLVENWNALEGIARS